MNRTGLSQLVHPVTKRDFLSRYWLKKSLITHGNKSLLSKLMKCPELQSTNALLHMKCKRIKAWFRDERGQLKQVALKADDALDLYSTGAVTLVVDGVNLGVPLVQEILDAVSKELETPQKNIQCNAYLSPSGKGTLSHFDEQENFLFQLKGSKIWKIGPNKIENPPQSYVVDLPIPDEILASKPGTTVLKPNFNQTVHLRPGSMMFIPRGYWHTSKASHESLALTFTFHSKAWVDVAMDELRRSLLKYPEWRTPAYSKARSRMESKKMLDSLGEEVSGLSISDDQMFRKNSGAKLVCRKNIPKSQGASSVYITRADGSQIEIAVNPKFLKLFSWVARQKKDFSQQQFHSAHSSVPSQVLRKILRMLSKEGYLSS